MPRGGNRRRPLSSAQTGVWFGQELDPTGQRYVIGQYVHVRGSVDPDLLHRAIAAVFAGSEPLRVRFVISDDRREQVVEPDVHPRLTVVDLTGEAEPVDAARQRMRELLAEPFDLATAPVFRTALYRLSEHDHYWCLTSHHLVTDGVGGANLIRRVAEAYTLLVKGTDPPHDVFDPLDTVLADDTAYRQSARFEEDRRYWADRLANLGDPPGLGSASAATISAPPRATGRLASRDWDLLAHRAEEIGQRRTSLVVVAAALLVHRVAGAQDVVLGLPVTARTGRAARNSLGTFATVLPLRLTVRPGDSVRDTAAQAGRAVLAALRRQRYRHEDILRELGGSAGRRIVGPVLNLMTMDPDLSFAGNPATVHELSPGTPEDLAIGVYDNGETSVRVDLDANPTTHRADEVEAHHGRFLGALSALARSAPDTPLGRLSLDPGGPRTPATPPGAPDGAPARSALDTVTLDRMFERVAARQPGAAAVEDETTRLTYSELNRRANQLASVLRERGAGPEDLVAVVLPRTVDLPTALLAVLKTGAGYLPLDPAHPAERLAATLADARVHDIVTTTAVAAALAAAGPGPGAPPAPHRPQPLCLDTARTAHLLAGQPADDPDRGQGPSADRCAYVIYTSGSTGRPKGVSVSHRNLVRLLHSTDGAFHFGPEDVWTLFHSCAFDFSVWEMWGALLTGGRLVVVGHDVSRSPSDFLRLLVSHRVTILNQTPSAFYQLDAAIRDEPATATALALRHVIFGGEALDPWRLTDWYARNGTTRPALTNMYGITETTVHVTRLALTPATAATATNGGSPVGDALPDLRVHLLDAALQPLPPGVPGELYVEGSGVARGYRHRPGLTATRFVANPFGPPGSVLYRSGDIARRNHDGELEHLGRADRQVKIRGFRIEPAEVEEALLRHPAVTSAAVVPTTDRRGTSRLVGYLTTTPHVDTPTTTELRGWLAESLPSHLVPTALVTLDVLPLTPNGKLDHRALPAPRFASSGHGLPTTDRQRRLCALFAEVLEVPEVRTDDDFFALGGDSLRAFTLVARIRADLGIEAGIRVLFDNPTVAAFTAATGDPASAEQAPVARPRPRTVPAAPTQRRLWVLQELTGPSGTYNIPVVLRLDGNLDLPALRLAVTDVVRRHESLRTTLPTDGEGPRQHVIPPDDPRLDLAVLSTRRAALEREIVRLAEAGFDLVNDPPVRPVLLTTEYSGEHVLILVLHHVAADEKSLAPLFRDLSAAYTARAVGTAPAWPGLPLQYADHTLWLRDRLGDEDDPSSRLHQGLAHWRQELLGAPEELLLPTDRDRRPSTTRPAGETSVRIDAGTHRRILSFAARHRATTFMVLHATLAATLTRAGAGDDVPVGTVAVGRSHPVLDELVGFFAETVVLRTDVSGRPTFTELIARVRHTDLVALANQDIPFDRVVDAVGPARVPGRHPLFQVMITSRDAGLPAPVMPGLSVRPLPFRPRTAKFDLHLDLAEHPGGGGIELTLRYDRALFDDSTARTITRWYRALLHGALAEPDRPLTELALDRVDRPRQPAGTPTTPADSNQDRARVLDTTLRPTPPGAVGELFLAVPPHRLGYRGTPATTASRYVADPLGGGRRLLRTGRWARRLPSGRLRILAHPSAPVAHPPGPETAGAAPAPHHDLHASNGEALLTTLVADVLGLPSVAPTDGFFALGGDSITAIRLASRARAAGLTLTPTDVFAHRTLRSLAAAAERGSSRERREARYGDAGEVPATPVMDWLRARGGPIARFSQSVLVSTPAGTTPEELVLAFQAVLDHHDALRLRLLRDPDDTTWRFVVDPPGHVRAEDCLTRVDGAATPAALEDGTAEARARLDPDAGRMARLVWFDPGPSTAGQLLLVAHHLCVDGVSWSILLSDLAEAHRLIRLRRPVELPAVPVSFRSWAARLRELVVGGALEGERPRWAARLSGHSSAPITLGCRPLDPSQDTAATARTVHLALDPDHTAPLLAAIPARYHATLEDVLLATLLVAIRSQRPGREPLSLLVDVEGHGREAGIGAPAGAADPEELDLSRTVGWFTTIRPVWFDLAPVPDTVAPDGDAAHLDRVLKSVKEHLRAMPHQGAGHGLLRQADRLRDGAAAGGEPLPTPSAQLAFNYLGRFDLAEAGEWAPLPGQDTTPLAVGADPELPLTHPLTAEAHVERGTAGPRLVVRLTWPAGLLPETETRELLARWGEALRTSSIALRRPGLGGHTPSDFPLVALDQLAVDELTAWYPAPLDDVLPLAPLQQGLLFHRDLSNDDADPYLVQLSLTLDGPLDPADLRERVRGLPERHPNLTAAFVTLGSAGPVQVWRADVTVPWLEVDLTADGTVSPTSEALEALLASERAHPLVPHRPPLLRFALARTGPRRWTLVLTHHHLILDGWSLPLLVAELLGHQDVSATPAASYRTFLAWQRRQDRAAARAAWARALLGQPGGGDQPVHPPVEPTLLGRRGGPSQNAGAAEQHEAHLPRDLAESLDQLARSCGVTLNTVVRAAWALLLAQFTGTRDVVFGTTVAHRPPEIAGIDRTIGLLIGTVPVRVRLRLSETVAQLLERLHREDTALLDHQHLGLAEIQELAGGTPLFDTTVVVENYPLRPTETSHRTPVAGGGPAVRIAEVGVHDGAHYPLALVVEPTDTLRLRLAARPAALRTGIGGRDLLDRFVQLLAACAANPGARVASLDSTSPADHQNLLSWGKGPAVEVPDLNLAELVDQTVRAAPDRVAVVERGAELTYAELDAAADRLARRVAAAGARPGDAVLVLLERSAAVVITALALAKAAALNVAVHGSYSPDRLRRIRAHTNAVLALVDADHAARSAEELHGLRTLVVGSPHSDEPSSTPAWPQGVAPRAHPAQPALLLFTSGTSGEPKGVTVRHRDLVGRLLNGHWRRSRRHTSLFHSSHAWDAVAFEVWSPLSNGDRIVVAPPGVLSVEDIRELVTREGITRLLLTAGMLAVVAETDPDALVGVSRLETGGDVVPPHAVARLRRHLPEMEVLHCYGPVETTAFAVAHVLRPGSRSTGPLPLGTPVDGSEIRLLDSALRPTPPGAPGEIWIAGTGLTAGYHRAPSLTASRFVPDPFGPPGSLMYRTGDLGRWDEEGSLYFLGREDRQVKVNGYRVEPGEVEGALTALPEVAQAVVVVRRSATGGQRLVAHLVPVPEPARQGPETPPPARLDVEAVREHAALVLPGYLVPSDFLVTDRLPLDRHGKVDTSQLRDDPGPPPPSAPRRLPRTPVEDVLCGVFAAVLGRDRVDPDESFFGLGGDSLTAMRLVADATTALGRDLRVRDLYAAPTPAALAHRAGATGSPRPGPRTRPEVIPLSAAQERLWTVNYLHGADSAYNSTVAWRLVGSLDADALRAAVGDVLDRHESLRTVLPYVEGAPRQQVLPPGAGADLLVAGDMTAGQEDDEVAALADTGFDLTRELPVRARLLRLAEDEHLLVLVIHHSAVDGWSLGPLSADLATAYRARRSGQRPRWDRPAPQYADHTLWLAEALGDPRQPESPAARHSAYWRQRLAGLGAPVDLAFDRPRPPVASNRAGHTPLRVDAALHADVVRLAAESRATAFIVVQAAVAALLTRWGAGHDVVVGLVMAGRDGEDMAELVGCVANTVVLRVDTGGGVSFRELVRRCQAEVLAAHEHQQHPFERVVEEVNPPRSRAHHPLFQVVVAFQNLGWSPLGLAGVRTTPVAVPPARTPFELHFDIQERRDAEGLPLGLEGVLVHAADLFEPGTARRLAESFGALLREVVNHPDEPWAEVAPAGPALDER